MDVIMRHWVLRGQRYLEYLETPTLHNYGKFVNIDWRLTHFIALIDFKTPNLPR